MFLPVFQPSSVILLFSFPDPGQDSRIEYEVTQLQISHDGLQLLPHMLMLISLIQWSVAWDWCPLLGRARTSDSLSS